MKKKLRGCEVEISGTELHIKLNKPMGRVYSLSDSVWAYAQRGFSIHVHLPNDVQVLTAQDNPFRIEEIKSKFPDSPPWHRYWFAIKSKDNQQDTFSFCETAPFPKCNNAEGCQMCKHNEEAL